MLPDDRQLAALRMIHVIRDQNVPVRLPYLFSELNIDLATLSFNEVLAILVALDAELERGDYSESLKQRIRFAAPFAKADGFVRLADGFVRVRVPDDFVRVPDGFVVVPDGFVVVPDTDDEENAS
jgi:hypothetical protein